MTSNTWDYDLDYSDYVIRTGPGAWTDCSTWTYSDVSNLATSPTFMFHTPVREPEQPPEPCSEDELNDFLNL